MRPTLVMNDGQMVTFEDFERHILPRLAIPLPVLMEILNQNSAEKVIFTKDEYQRILSIFGIDVKEGDAMWEALPDGELITWGSVMEQMFIKCLREGQAVAIVH